MGSIDYEFQERPYFIKKLNPQQSVNLFLTKTKEELVRQQLLGLIEVQETYPYYKMLGAEHNKTPFHLTDELRNQLKIKLNQRDSMVHALSLHDMFVQICGNPFSIVLIARIYSNKANETKLENKLIDVYKKMLT